MKVKQSFLILMMGLGASLPAYTMIDDDQAMRFEISRFFARVKERNDPHDATVRYAFFDTEIKGIENELKRFFAKYGATPESRSAFFLIVASIFNRNYAKNIFEIFFDILFSKYWSEGKCFEEFKTAFVKVLDSGEIPMLKEAENFDQLFQSFSYMFFDRYSCSFEKLKHFFKKTEDFINEKKEVRGIYQSRIYESAIAGFFESFSEEKKKKGEEINLTELIDFSVELCKENKQIEVFDLCRKCIEHFFLSSRSSGGRIWLLEPNQTTFEKVLTSIKTSSGLKDEEKRKLFTFSINYLVLNSNKVQKKPQDLIDFIYERGGFSDEERDALIEGLIVPLFSFKLGSQITDEDPTLQIEDLRNHYQSIKKLYKKGGDKNNWEFFFGFSKTEKRLFTILVTARRGEKQRKDFLKIIKALDQSFESKEGLIKSFETINDAVKNSLDVLRDNDFLRNDIYEECIKRFMYAHQFSDESLKEAMEVVQGNFSESGDDVDLQKRDMFQSCIENFFNARQYSDQSLKDSLRIVGGFSFKNQSDLQYIKNACVNLFLNHIQDSNTILKNLQNNEGFKEISRKLKESSSNGARVLKSQDERVYGGEGGGEYEVEDREFFKEMVKKEGVDKDPERKKYLQYLWESYEAAAEKATEIMNKYLSEDQQKEEKRKSLYRFLNFWGYDSPDKLLHDVSKKNLENHSERRSLETPYLRSTKNLWVLEKHLLDNSNKPEKTNKIFYNTIVWRAPKALKEIKTEEDINDAIRYLEKLPDEHHREIFASIKDAGMKQNLEEKLFRALKLRAPWGDSLKKEIFFQYSKKEEEVQESYIKKIEDLRKNRKVLGGENFDKAEWKEKRRTILGLNLEYDAVIADLGITLQDLQQGNGKKMELAKKAVRLNFDRPDLSLVSISFRADSDHEEGDILTFLNMPEDLKEEDGKDNWKAGFLSYGVIVKTDESGVKKYRRFRKKKEEVKIEGLF